MTGWWGIYASKDKNHQDMLWPDMTVWFIVAYDLWNFTYTYNNLPTHSWYCGLALLLAPTFANALWNKGGWIQNRANTLATWCMFAQVVPMFQIKGRFSVLPVLYSNVEGCVLLNDNGSDQRSTEHQGTGIHGNHCIGCKCHLLKRNHQARNRAEEESLQERDLCRYQGFQGCNRTC